MKITKRATLVRMKKNPMRVTMFGASHNGSNSTNAFHYSGVSFRDQLLDLDRSGRAVGDEHMGEGCSARRVTSQPPSICRSLGD